MASTTELRAVAPMSTRAALAPAAPTSTAAAGAATRSWFAPAVAAGIGAFSGVLATWAIVATQTLHMSL